MMTVENESDLRGIIVIVAAIGVGVAIGIPFGCRHGAEVEHAAAIKAGAGRWIVDAKTGEATFRYGCGEALPR